MSVRLEDRVGQLLFVGFEGHELDAGTRDLLTTVRPGGVILFRRNCVDGPQIARLTREIRALYTPAPVLGVDEEGGRVTRLSPPLPDTPAAWRLGALDMPTACQWFGSLIGRGLRSLGFHVDFAPVVDLSCPGVEDGIGDRAFGDTADAVVSRAGGFLAGLAEAGVAGCLKHFPGHGGAPLDSHVDLPTLDRSARDIEEALLPYRRLAANTPQIMTAHVHDPALAGEPGRPASLDRRVIEGLLRGDVGFDGVVLSDDLEMGAVARRAPFGDLAVQALAAGNDQVLVCRHADNVHAAWEGLRRAAGSGDLDENRVRASLRRIDRFKSGPAASRPDEPFEPEELTVAADEMRGLTDEVDRALRRRGL